MLRIRALQLYMTSRESQSIGTSRSHSYRGCLARLILWTCIRMNELWSGAQWTNDSTICQKTKQNQKKREKNCDDQQRQKIGIKKRTRFGQVQRNRFYVPRVHAKIQTKSFHCITAKVQSKEEMFALAIVKMYCKFANWYAKQSLPQNSTRCHAIHHFAALRLLQMQILLLKSLDASF